MTSRKGSQMLADGLRGGSVGSKSVVTEMAGFAGESVVTEMAGFAEPTCRSGGRVAEPQFPLLSGKRLLSHDVHQFLAGYVVRTTLAARVL